MRTRAGRSLAFAAASAALCSAFLAVPAPVRAATDSPVPAIPAGDLCGHVQNRDVYALIASPGDGIFSVDSSQVEAGKLTCVWSARKTGAPDNTAPDATLTLDLYHFANVARARTELRGFGVAAHAPHTPTHDADDEVIALSASSMAARHGVEIAVARATVSQALSRDPDWNTRLEALTLAGAGAQLPVPPASSACASAAPSPAIAAEAWRPPARRLPASNATFVPFLHVIWQLTHWRFEFVAVAIVSALVIGAIAVRMRRLAILWLVPFVFGYALLNLIFGPDWGTALVYRFGDQAPATVTGTFATNDVYNNQNVVGYHVLIRPVDGNIVESRFRSDDFNVYPPHNATRYPDTGDVFTVRYLRGYPGDFVIVSNDGSPWSNRLHCEALAIAAGQADQKAGFAPDNPPFRQAAQAAHAALQTAGCAVDDSTE